MALFKILKGSSTRLPTVSPTEGYAYFTPDDGKFYIDIKTESQAIVGNSQSEKEGVNRICINPDIFSNILIFDCGTASEEWETPDAPIIYWVSLGDSDGPAIGENVVIYSNGDSDLTDEQNARVFNSGTSSYNI